jgi:hypothetical protein
MQTSALNWELMIIKAGIRGDEISYALVTWRIERRPARYNLEMRFCARLLVTILLAGVGSSHGQDLPENPQVDPANVYPVVHRFWDRTNILLFTGVGITRGMDYASTRNFQARGRDEILIPDDVVNNSAGFASLEAAGTATSIGIAYLLHRTGHHKLERWMSIGHIGVTGFGDVRNYCLKTRRRP